MEILEIVECADDLLTIGLNEPEIEEESKKAYSEMDKLFYNLLFEYSSDSKEQAFLNEVLDAPLKQEVEQPKVTPFGAIKREEAALKSRLEQEKYERKVAKLNKAAVESKVKPKVKPKVEPNKEKTPIKKEDVRPKYKWYAEKEFNEKFYMNFTLTLKKSELLNEKVNTKDYILENEDVRLDPGKARINNNNNNNNTEIINKVLKRMNEIYIASRKKGYVEQYFHKKDEIVKYRTEKYTFTDKQLKQHLQKKKTYGVFAGKEETKFICFDVDSGKNLEYSKVITKELVNVLVNIFKIEEEYINISISGLKGYHVELFFDKMKTNHTALSLFNAVISFLEIKNGAEIEFRPTFTQAVKLPLSLNLNGGNTCYFVDTNTLEPITDPLHILKIKQLPTNKLKNIFENKSLFNHESEVAAQPKDTKSEKNLKTKSVKVNNNSKANDDVVEFLKKGSLIHPNTRNNMTLKSAMFLNGQGQTEYDAFQIIFTNLTNTWNNNRDMFSKNTTLKYIEAETERIVKSVFLKNQTLSSGKKEIKIYKREMEAVISLNKVHLRKLLFTFIVHSKKYANLDGSFYFAYSSIAEYGNNPERGALLRYIYELQALNLVEIVSRGAVNKALTREKGHVISETNSYRVTLDEPDETEPFITVNTTKKVNMYRAAKHLVNKKTIKEKVSRKEWDNHFKKLYK